MKIVSIGEYPGFDIEICKELVSTACNFYIYKVNLI